MSHVNLMIVTPGHSLHRLYVNSLLNTSTLLAEKGLTFGWSGQFSSNVYDAREISLNGGFENDVTETRPFRGEVSYDKILWIDSDIVWKPEDVLKLYESDKEVTSGVYFQANGAVMAFKELFGAPMTYEDIKNEKTPFEIYAAGFGFICFKKGVFESLPRPWFQMVSGTKNINGNDVTFPILGEDLSLCQRLQDANIKLWLDPTVIVGHIKSVVISELGVNSL